MRVLVLALAIGVVAAGAPARRPSAQPAGSQAGARAPARRGTAVIRGRVIAADSEAPIRRARVSWVPERSSSNRGLQPASVMTDAGGRYEIPNLPAGRYRVYARRSGYLLMGFGARRGGTSARAVPTQEQMGNPIDLADGQTFPKADFRLPRAAAIVGRIQDEFGDPLIASRVVATRFEIADGRRRLVPFATDATDDLGEYRLSGLPPGSYYVVASAPAYLRSARTSYADMFYPGVPDRVQARPVAIREGQEISEITMMLPALRLARLSGRVIMARGVPARSASISVLRRSETGDTQTMTFPSTVQATGQFTLSGIPPGECDLIAEAAEYGPPEFGVLHVSVGSEDIEGLTINTGAEGRVTGSVKTDTGAPLPVPQTTATTPAGRPMPASFITVGWIVALGVEDGSDGVLGPATRGNASAPGVFTSSGSFSASVRPGPRVIDVNGMPPGWGIVSVTSGARNLTDFPVEVQPGTTFGVQIVISDRLPEISGTAVDADGKPASDYEVVVFPRDSSRWLPGCAMIRSDRPNQRGEFRFAGLRPGAYYVVAVASDDEADWTDPNVLYNLRAVSERITVALGDKKTVQLKIRSSSE